MLALFRALMVGREDIEDYLVIYYVGGLLVQWYPKE